MITIAGLVWDNWFSYGEGNFLQTDDSKVTQITGVNGTGKSSIPVIIGEILYGKNNLGKAKSKLFNRYLDTKHIFANLEFMVDEDKYAVTYDRKSTLKLTLHKNDIDISSHTATETYKTIESILGYEFNTFWNLIYQSSKDGLDFLTATDTTRKKFLVKLFNISEYVVIHEFFKCIANNKNTEMLVEKGKLSVVNSWIEENEKIDLTEMPLLPIPNINKKDIDKLANLKSKLQNIHEINKKINYNEQLKSILAGLDTSILSVEIIVPNNKQELDDEKDTLWSKIGTCAMQIEVHVDYANKMEGLKGTCPTCEQDIDEDFLAKLIKNSKDIVLINETQEETYRDRITEIDTELLKIVEAYKQVARKNKISEELADLLAKINNDLPTKVEVGSDIQDEIDVITLKIYNIEQEIINISAQNLKAGAHNAKIKVVKNQLIEYTASKLTLEESINEVQELITHLTVLKKAFSTNGLIGYKLESLSKELEDQINIYLAELSVGRFQLRFTISGEKLNIDIIDDSNIVGIEDLSSGELARVNTATLLAVRKLMAAISSSKLNILFLDEIMAVLDDEGKETLVDILLDEKELNTFLVSHEFTHPLIPQINIIKINNISSIED